MTRLTLCPIILSHVSSTVGGVRRYLLDKRVASRAISFCVWEGRRSVKTRMQRNRSYGGPTSPAAILRDAWARNGVLGFYAGYTPRLAGIVPMRVTFWGTQSFVKDRLQGSSLPPLAQTATVGLCAGSAQTLVDNPMEVLKTRLMTTSKSVSMGSIIREGNFPGFSATLTRNVVFAVLFATGLHWRSTDRLDYQMMRGAVSGFVSSLITQPLDYCKTVMQAESSDSAARSRSVVAILRQTSLRHAMTGAVPRATLAMLNMSVGAVVFSFLERVLVQGYRDPTGPSPPAEASS